MKEATTRAQGQKGIADVIGQSCLAGRIRILSRSVTGIYDESLRPLGLKVTQMSILVVAARMGRVSPGRLAERLAMDKSTLSRNVERLERQGWLAVLEGKDERSQLLQVTARGQKLLERAYPLWQQAQEQTEALLGERGSVAICRMVERIWKGKQTG
ncbi:MAG: winged helix-turn-helix transcriptional regulator [Planctomycetes bacterium]|nr:winged helix-turn-helix transcriptional regulator [Planctomycetota bacterium]